MKIWVDDVRPAPKGYVWCKSVIDVISLIGLVEKLIYNYQWDIDTASFPELHSGLSPIVDNIKKEIEKQKIEVIDIDHDAGDYISKGGDYIRLLDWIEATGRNFPIHIHSMNPVGAENMRRIIEKNGWRRLNEFQSLYYFCSKFFN